MPGIFISYRREDTSGHAGRLHGELARRYGSSRVFMDIDSIPSGTPFRDRIRQALDSCDVTLVLIGKHWAAPRPGESEKTAAARRLDEKEDFVRLEVAAALARNDVAVIPVLVEGANIPAVPDDLERLTTIQDCKLRNTEWRADMARICRTIDQEDRLWKRAYRRGRRIVRQPLVAGLVLSALAVGAVLAVEPAGPRPIGCDNLPIPKDARSKLSRAAGSSASAIDGSVYYGACGHRAWALADFPDGSTDAFAQSGFHWSDLGPAATRGCARIPAELVDEWVGSEVC